MLIRVLRLITIAFLVKVMMTSPHNSVKLAQSAYDERLVELYDEFQVEATWRGVSVPPSLRDAVAYAAVMDVWERYPEKYNYADSQYILGLCLVKAELVVDFTSDHWFQYQLKREIIISRNAAKDEDLLRSVMFHELAHCVLNLDHGDYSRLMGEYLPDNGIPPEELGHELDLVFKQYLDLRRRAGRGADL